jgi:type IX secretion system PorP/SprF family membrane protein
MGLGILVVQDKNGNTKNSEVQAAYAYRIDFGKRILSFGLQAGIINFRVDNNELNPFDPNDPTFLQNQNITKPSFGAGIILSDERFFLGLSIPRMLKVRDNYEEFQTDLYNQHFYSTAAYVFFLSERVRLKPSALVKGLKGAPLSIDGNLSLNLDEKYTAGVFTRNLNTYGLLLQFRFAKSFRFGYTFEVPANNSVGTRFTTHEVCLGLNMALFKTQEDIVTNF